MSGLSPNSRVSTHLEVQWFIQHCVGSNLHYINTKLNNYQISLWIWYYIGNKETRGLTFLLCCLVPFCVLSLGSNLFNCFWCYAISLLFTYGVVSKNPYPHLGDLIREILLIDKGSISMCESGHLIVTKQLVCLGYIVEISCFFMSFLSVTARMSIKVGLLDQFSSSNSFLISKS